MKKMILSMVVCFGMVACGGSVKRSDAGDGARVAQGETGDRVEVLYFHGKARCATCVAIERGTVEAVEGAFADEMREGKVVLRTIDISKAENEAMAERYEVTWSSLMVTRWRDGEERVVDMTEFAFANARRDAEGFKRGVVEMVNEMRE